MLQVGVQKRDLTSLAERLGQFEKRAAILKEKESRFSAMLAEKESLKESLHEQEMQNLLLEQRANELQERIRGLEEEIRRGQSGMREREIQGQEMMQTLKQYRTKIHKLNDKVTYILI